MKIRDIENLAGARQVFTAMIEHYGRVVGGKLIKQWEDLYEEAYLTGDIDKIKSALVQIRGQGSARIKLTKSNT